MELLLSFPDMLSKPEELHLQRAVGQEPRTREWLRRAISRMVRGGVIRPVAGSHQRVFEVSVPYAEKVPLDEADLALEANPYAAISHLSALIAHGMTERLPKSTCLTTPRDALNSGVLPLGTRHDDWIGLALPQPFLPTRLAGFGYDWITVHNKWFFGHEDRGKLRLANLERTLLDGLREPELCGGMGEVLRVWREARGTVKIPLLIEYGNAFNICVLRQRIGFVMERLGLGHPELEKWKRQAHRGGSSRLLASAPFAAAHDKDWRLSINCPIEELRRS